MLATSMPTVLLELGQKSKAGTSVMEIASRRQLRNHLYIAETDSIRVAGEALLAEARYADLPQTPRSSRRGK